MFKKYIPKESWDYEKAHAYALKKLAHRSYSSNLLREALLLKTTETHTETIIHELTQKGLLDDQALCNGTAQEWVEKKPISKIQLCKKLAAYKFEYECITASMRSLEKLHKEHELGRIGGVEISRITHTCDDAHDFSLWDLLALSACLLTLECSTTTQDTQSLIQKLQLKGYSIHTKLFEAIQKLIDKTQS